MGTDNTSLTEGFNIEVHANLKQENPTLILMRRV